MKSFMMTALLNAVGLAVIVWVIRSKLKGRDRATENLSHLARALNLQVQPRSAIQNIDPLDRAALKATAVGRAGAQMLDQLPGARGALYAGEVEGLRVTMELNAERRGESGQSLHVAFSAHPDVSWRLGLSIAREHAMDHLLQPGRQSEDLTSGDAPFDRDVFVRADAKAPVTEALRSPELRAAIRSFLVEHPRSWIDDHGVHTKLVASSASPELVQPIVLSMVALVRALEVGFAASP